eukprot:5206891-Amphidinium_carterae.2
MLFAHLVQLGLRFTWDAEQDLSGKALGQGLEHRTTCSKESSHKTRYATLFPRPGFLGRHTMAPTPPWPSPSGTSHVHHTSRLTSE